MACVLHSVYAQYFLLFQVHDYTRMDKSIEISLLSSYKLNYCVILNF